MNTFDNISNILYDAPYRYLYDKSGVMECAGNVALAISEYMQYDDDTIPIDYIYRELRANRKDFGVSLSQKDIYTAIGYLTYSGLARSDGGHIWPTRSKDARISGGVQMKSHIITDDPMVKMRIPLTHGKLFEIYAGNEKNYRTRESAIRAQLDQILDHLATQKHLAMFRQPDGTYIMAGMPQYGPYATWLTFLVVGEYISACKADNHDSGFADATNLFYAVEDRAIKAPAYKNIDDISTLRARIHHQISSFERHGYAVVNYDGRGLVKLQGDILNAVY